MDRRLTPATARIAHASLRERLDGVPFTDGMAQRVTAPLVDLLRAPFGARDRQLVFGAEFCAIDHDQDHVFGFAIADGYCGWLPQSALGAAPAPTHWVASTGTHLYPNPRVQSREIAALPMGAMVCVSGGENGFAQVNGGFVPLPHLRKVGEVLDDPAGIAVQFLGTPYLWGGNSRAGLDCSGLMQISLRACGIAAAADSDLQQVLGQPIAQDALLIRGDLLFWKGHVAMVIAPDQLIHANGHTMSVAIEAIAACTIRIAAQGGGPVTHRRRLA